MKTRTVFSLLTASVAFSAVAVPAAFENDFSRRSDAAKIDRHWVETTYVPERQVANYYYDVPPPSDITSAPWWDRANVQDNWFIAHNGISEARGVFAICTNSSDTASLPGDANQCLRFGLSDKPSSTISLAQPFYNSFTDGVLRISADLRAPTHWPTGNGYIRIMPVCRAGFKTLSWASSTVQNRSIASFGLQKHNADAGLDDAQRSWIVNLKSSDGKGGGQYLDTSYSHVNGHWYRFVMDLDLTAGKMTGFVYDQGTAHPNMTDANGSKVLTVSKDGYLNWTLKNAGAGPIEGIGIRVQNVQSATTLERLRCPLCDNIVCSWKRPGGTDFERFYENDFSVRRRRVICPSAETTGDYVRETVATTCTSKPYAEHNVVGSSPTNFLLQIVSSLREGGAVAQPAGVAGWKRANTGNDIVAVVNYDGNNVLRYTGTGGYAALTQTLGEEISSGKVRLSFDFRTPDKWHWEHRGIYATLGKAELWGSANPNYTSRISARLGVSGNSETDFRAYTCGENGAVIVSDSPTFKSDTWYRGILTVDVTAKTCEGALYEIGDKPVVLSWQPTEAPVYTTGTRSLHKESTTIAAFGLSGYGAGSTDKTVWPTNKGHIYFDNVIVWKDWDDANGTGTLLYQDTFSEVTTGFSPQKRGLLVDAAAHVDAGQDRWVRRNNGSGSIWITSGENPCVAAVGGTQHTYAIRDLGTSYKKGVVWSQVDIRPPYRWCWDTARAAQVVIGGDQFLQGEMGTVNGKAFNKGRYGTFGFGDKNMYSIFVKSVELFSTMNIYFSNGDGAGNQQDVYSSVTVDTTHWYRFRARFDLTTWTYEVDVYDMGTAHPTFEDADGKLVCSQKNLGIRSVRETNGITSVGLTTFGNPALVPSDPEDPGLALYDNLRVWQDPCGMKILVK